MTDQELADDVVITPGGVRHRSLMHAITVGTTLDGSGGRHRMLGPDGEELADFGLIDACPPGPGLMPDGVVPPIAPDPTSTLDSGWLAYTSWNRPDEAITSFSSTWTVPPSPATKNGQLIYLFSGLQNSTMIYQPVLQWGNNGVFGGNYWCLASWYAAGPGSAAFYSNPVPVNPGDELTGVITLTEHSSTGFSYACEFTDVANSGYAIANVPELWQAVQALAAYHLTARSDLPHTDKAQIRAITLQAGTTMVPTAQPVRPLDYGHSPWQ